MRWVSGEKLWARGGKVDSRHRKLCARVWSSPTPAYSEDCEWLSMAGIDMLGWDGEWAEEVKLKKGTRVGFKELCGSS